MYLGADLLLSLPSASRWLTRTLGGLRKDSEGEEMTITIERPAQRPVAWFVLVAAIAALALYFTLDRPAGTEAASTPVVSEMPGVHDSWETFGSRSEATGRGGRAGIAVRPTTNESSDAWQGLQSRQDGFLPPPAVVPGDLSTGPQIT